MKFIKLTRIVLIFSLFIELSSCSGDPCEDVVCLNGGSCANGECVCPDGFEGADCSKQITPLRINISRIEVLSFSQTEESGGGWDLTSGPDIYPVFLIGSNTIFKADTYYENATTGNVYSWDLNGVSITSPLDRHIIRLYDYDSFDADDYMGGVVFSPYTRTNGFPRTLSAKYGDYEFKFYVSYVWP